MGNLGGQAWNTPESMNRKGEVVGFGNTSGDQNAPYSPMAFYWSQTTGMLNLESLSEFPNSAANAINNEGLIVGEAFNASNSAVVPHAFVYRNGIMTDLNALMIANKSLTLLYANDVNDEGVIVGGAYDSKTNTYPAFVAIPF
jgi:probable HAF family extracellular repeat protein